MAKPFTQILGVVLLAMGTVSILTGWHDHKMILFGVKSTHALFCILWGALAVLAGYCGQMPAKFYCIVFGAVSVFATIVGFAERAPLVSWRNFDTPDDLLYLAIGAVCLVVGFGKTSSI